MKLEYIIFGIGMFVTSLCFGQEYKSPIRLNVDSLCALNKEYSEKSIKIGEHILENPYLEYPITFRGKNFKHNLSMDRLNNVIPYQFSLINKPLNGDFDICICLSEIDDEKDCLSLYIMPGKDNFPKGISLRDFGFDGNIDEILIYKEHSITGKHILKFEDLTKAQKEDLQRLYEKFIDFAYESYF